MSPCEKTVQHHHDCLSRWLVKFRTQYNTKTGPQTDNVWHILWRQRERQAVATDFLRRPYATPEWRWFGHANTIYGITTFMLNGLYRNTPVFFEDNFLILEHKVSFGFVPYPSSVLICKNRPQGKRPMSPRLSLQWSVAQQRDSRPGYIFWRYQDQGVHPSESVSLFAGVLTIYKDVSVFKCNALQ